MRSAAPCRGRVSGAESDTVSAAAARECAGGRFRTLPSPEVCEPARSTALIPPSDPGGTAMFDVERFTQECLRANAEVDAHKAALDLVERTCSDPAAVPRRARRADMRRGDQALPQRRSHDPRHRVGSVHDAAAARPSDVGGHRDLHRARGQHLLAPPARARRRIPQGAGAPARSGAGTPCRWGRMSSTRSPTRCRA